MENKIDFISKNLKQIYQYLSLISTKGEDTIRMGQCLTALSKVYEDCINIIQELNTEEKTLHFEIPIDDLLKKRDNDVNDNDEIKE